jgi:hypothetical protein
MVAEILPKTLCFSLGDMATFLLGAGG